VQDIESGIDKENRDVGDESVEGTYPIAPKLTQKINCDNIIQYWIPDNYIIETEVAEKKVKCETKWESNSK
ncbi:2244_t:CDS:2, partial [Diversispora eburnea]